MKLYIKNYSSYRSDKEDVDIKKELKQKYKYDTRRQDEFIHLAVYGAQLLKDKTEINEDDELYVTSGVGNIDVVQRTNTNVYENNQFIRLFDFINLLGNTTSYYVASALEVKGKNIFQISDNFTYINSLISLYASIKNSKKDAIMCALDFVNTPQEVTKRTLGVQESCELTSSVNYQKFSLHPENAIAEIEFDAKFYDLNEIKDFLLLTTVPVQASFRCEGLDLEEDAKVFETVASYAVNKSVENSQDLIFIDCFENRYKILKIKSLK